MSLWLMPEMQSKIDSLRNVFSADIRKPFILNPSSAHNVGLSTNPNDVDDVQPEAAHCGRGRLADLKRSIFQHDQGSDGGTPSYGFTSQPAMMLAPVAFPTSSTMSHAIGRLPLRAYMRNVECGDISKQTVDKHTLPKPTALILTIARMFAMSKETCQL
jgi:hypothetical protein